MSNDMEVLKALPVLQKIWESPTLSDYFRKTIFPLAQMTDVPEKQVMANVIKTETERLYGPETAQGIYEQIDAFPVAETGTHLAFLRDYDNLQKDDLRSRLNQNILISAGLMRHMGQKYHVGIYGSNVSLNHPCGGGYFQLGDEIFPVSSLRNVNQFCLYDTDGIDKKHINESLPLTAKLKMLNEVLTDDIIQNTPMPRQAIFIKTRKMVNSLLLPVKNGKVNYELVLKMYNDLNHNNQSFIKDAMLFLSAAAYKKYGYTFSDVDKQYQELQSVLDRRDLKLPDQVALVQSNMINKALDGTGIQHVSIDAVEVARQFLISELENKNSLWYKIFSHPENFKKMQETFVGIRSSWKANESPFDYIAKDKGFSKHLSLPLEAVEHTPEALLPLLKDKKIIPSSALIVLAFQSAGLMAHGGFFQTPYAEKIKNRFVGYLQSINEEKHTENLKKLPVDMALLSLAVQNDASGKPMKLSEISRMSSDKKKELMDEIPQYPSCRAVTNALPTLGKYLDTTAPGYVQTEAANASFPQLTCHHGEMFPKLSQILKRQYTRSA